ncbi:hypothetical protein E2C01_008148 [Portunus trituberculatus]|uniref:Uncharacterized protein n=1 Tax=Portunus trituberculatus TaxID=210409 RepID=A0A5B7D0V3_PORTR|nr:hypothetical protein [Portunus trituberculatus]
MVVKANIVKAGAASGLREHQPLETTGVFKEMLFSIRIFVNTTQMRRNFILKTLEEILLFLHICSAELRGGRVDNRAVPAPAQHCGRLPGALSLRHQRESRCPTQGWPPSTSRSRWRWPP